MALVGGTAMSANEAGKTKGALGQVASTPGTDWRGTQSSVIRQNQSLIPEVTGLAGDLNKANQTQRLEMLNRAVPHYGDITSQAGSNILDLLRGEIPDDVSDSVLRNAASRSLAGGYAGSGMHGNLSSRDLGLTSLDLQKTGLESLPSFLQSLFQTGVPNQFDPSSMLLSPTSIIDLEGRERGQSMQAALAAAGAPGAGQVWGSGLQQIGGALVGGGLTSRARVPSSSSAGTAYVGAPPGGGDWNINNGWDY